MQDVIPDFTIKQSVTLRQLLNHTSGLPDYGTLAAYAEDVRTHPKDPWTVETFLERTLAQDIRFPSGKGWAYSNIGFLLVRQAIEGVLQTSLREALSNLIFDPLGLKASDVAETLADALLLAPGFSTMLDGDGSLHDIRDRYHPAWVSHGVVRSTAMETARIIDALFSGQLIGPTMMAEMLKAEVVPGTHHLIAKPGYGLGLMIDLDTSHGLIAGHGGEGPGYSTAAFHFEDLAGRRVTSVAFANRDVHDLGLRIAFGMATDYAHWTPDSRSNHGHLPGP